MFSLHIMLHTDFTKKPNIPLNFDDLEICYIADR
jgi:hypothetical protein